MFVSLTQLVEYYPFKIRVPDSSSGGYTNKIQCPAPQKGKVDGLNGRYRVIYNGCALCYMFGCILYLGVWQSWSIAPVLKTGGPLAGP